MKNIFLIFALFFAFSFAGNGPVSYYGKLQASGNKIAGSKTGSAAVQVRGVSFGWTTTDWESSRFYRADAVGAMVNDWKAEVVRAAYGATASAAGSPVIQNRARVEILADAALANDVYFIIDWHSHSAENEVENSKAFFEYMASKYGSYDNVIFEIYNEPINASWANIKAYAEQIIPIIRAHSSNLILVGTPFYSQQVEKAVGNAINDANVGYVVHFYAYSHPLSNFQNNINTALNAGLPIFVTEWGTTHSDGGQSDKNHYDTHNPTEADKWFAFMDQNKISSAAWEVNDKYAGSAFFGIQDAAKKFDMQSWADKTKMTQEGQYVFNKLNEYAKSAPWRSGQTPIKPIEAENLAISGDASIEIFSLQGKKMGNSLSNLNKGIYILLLKQGSQTKSMKIVKK
ncbi:MAG: cellulase family glycosylhydrolase [Fibromonadales bacterium]|nr:cellulase family glycosylhydrolase [Fibromonadales bacterium]